MKKHTQVEVGFKNTEISLEKSVDKTKLDEQDLLEEETKDLKLKKDPVKKPFLNVWKGLGVIGLIGISVVGWRWWQEQLNYVSTDNAQIQGHISSISSRVSEIVEKVLVSDGDYVKAGQPLVILETRDLKLGVEEAKANLRAAQARLKMATQTVGITKDTNTTQIQQAQANLVSKQAGDLATVAQIQQAQASMNAALNKVNQSKASVEVAKANVNKAQAQVNKAQADWKRYEYLAAQGAVSVQQRDTAITTLKSAQAELLAGQEQVKQQIAEIATNQALLQQAQAQIQTAKAQLQQAEADTTASNRKVAETQAQGQQVQIQQSQSKSAQAQVEQAQAALALAEQQLNYAVIKSPVTGYVGLGLGQLTVQVGQLVQPQQPLLSIVPLQTDQLYVEANFKETALNRLRVGSRAEVEADAYPGKVFEAVVAGISPATGAQFALIPPDNATGNFNKVVQWVPVRLTFSPGTDPGHLLRAGLSVRVRVRVRQ